MKIPKTPGEFKKMTKNLEIVYANKLVDTNVLFLEQDIIGWEKFAQSLIEFNKETHKSKNIRIKIILTSLMVEKILDMIIISFYRLNKHLKYDPYNFLSKISLRNKIEVIKELKIKYPSLRTKETLYRPSIDIKTSIEGWEKLKSKYGKNFPEELQKINEEMDAKSGTIKPKWACIYKYPPDDGFMDDDLFKLTQRIDTGKLHELDDYRNTVAHYLDTRDLLDSHKKTEEEIRNFCENILYELAGIVSKKSKPSNL